MGPDGVDGAGYEHAILFCQGKSIGAPSGIVSPGCRQVVKGELVNGVRDPVFWSLCDAEERCVKVVIAPRHHPFEVTPPKAEPEALRPRDWLIFVFDAVRGGQ